MSRMVFQPVGVDYCTRHNGIRDVDQDECDFKDDERKCVLRQLGYRVRR